MIYKKYLYLIFLLVPALSWGESLSEKRLSASKKISVLADLSLDSNLQKFTTIDDSSGATLSILPSYKFSWGQIRALAGAYKRLEWDERLDLLNFRVGAVFNRVKLGDSVSLRPGLHLILPTHSYDFEQLSYRGGILGNLTTIWSLNSSLFVQGATRGILNFHYYRVSETGRPNLQASLRQTVSLGYIFLKKFQLLGSFGLQVSRSYHGYYRNNFSHSQSLTYSHSDKLSVSLALGNRGSLRSADGGESNIAFFDERNTSTSVSLTYFY